MLVLSRSTPSISWLLCSLRPSKSLEPGDSSITIINFHLAHKTFLNEYFQISALEDEEREEDEKFMLVKIVF